MLDSMSDNESAPKPAQSDPAPQPKPSERAPSPRVPTLFEMLCSPQSIPGWASVILGPLFAIANVVGAVELYLPAVRSLGGGAAMIFELLASPFAVALVFFGLFHLWVVADEGVESENKRKMAFATWFALAFFVIPFCSLALFGYFVFSSKIPEIASYVEQQSKVRRLTGVERGRLYLRRSPQGDRPPGTVRGGRSPRS